MNYVSPSLIERAMEARRRRDWWLKEAEYEVLKPHPCFETIALAGAMADDNEHELMRLMQKGTNATSHD